MATTYVDDEHIFNFKAEGPVHFGSFSLRLSLRGSGFSHSETDINTAIQAFADSLNTSGHEHIDKVDKVLTAAGVSDWEYDPA